MCGLVDLVKVRALLAIDLYVDEIGVHRRRHLRVLERLVRHHMAPMARGITDRKQDRLSLATRESERLLIPGLPIHGVVGVLLKIRARFSREAIGHLCALMLARRDR